MDADPIQVLRAPAPPPAVDLRPRLLIAGATGVLGNEVLQRLVGGGRYAPAQVLAREPVTDALRSVAMRHVLGDDPAAWPPAAAETAVVLFEPARLYHDRERALWTPLPEQLPALAAWLRQGGVKTLAVVLPHDQGRLPPALQRGLASLDELAVAALDFERLLVIRSARKPAELQHASLPQRIAHQMLSIFKYMIPSTEQPVRSTKIAELLAVALELAPPGIHIAPPGLVWRAAQQDVREVARAWLQPA